MSGTARAVEGFLIGAAVGGLAVAFGWWALLAAPVIAAYAIWQGVRNP
jgi:hypothetical protein